jgi:uncharacterized protein (TIGR00730 family)
MAALPVGAISGRAGTLRLRICVLGGSSEGASPRFAAEARKVGRTLGARGVTLVYGGTTTGPMWHAAEAARAAGSTVIGVIPRAFYEGEWADIVDREAQLELVPTLSARKERMVRLADGFVALPGGYGTYDELFEVITQRHIGLHHKPIGLLNTRPRRSARGYYDPLLQLIRHGKAQGFIPRESDLLVVEGDAERLVARVLALTESASASASASAEVSSPAWRRRSAGAWATPSPGSPRAARARSRPCSSPRSWPCSACSRYCPSACSRRPRAQRTPRSRRSSRRRRRWACTCWSWSARA